MEIISIRRDQCSFCRTLWLEQGSADLYSFHRQGMKWTLVGWNRKKMFFYYKNIIIVHVHEHQDKPQHAIFLERTAYVYEHVELNITCGSTTEPEGIMTSQCKTVMATHLCCMKMYSTTFKVLICIATVPNVSCILLVLCCI